MLEQGLCEGVELVAVLPQEGDDLLMRLFDDPSYLLVYQLLRVLRDVRGAGRASECGRAPRPWQPGHGAHGSTALRPNPG